MFTKEVDIEYEPVIDILEDILGDHQSHNEMRGQMSFDCPVCSYEIKGLEVSDGKGNLEVNYKEEVFKCWVCSETHGTHGSIYKLIKKFGNPKQLKNYLLFRPENENGEKKRIYKKLYLPKEFILFSNCSQGFKMTTYYREAWNYLKRRNITDEIIKKHNIGFCYQGKYSNRIIIPSYDEYDDVNYFVARSYLSKSKKKYLNPEIDKETLIWNEHLINWDQPIYIVEGVFDSIFLPNSIPMLGKYMTKNLFDKLYDNAKEIIIVLDPDAWDDAVKLYHKLNCGKLMNKVWVIKLTDNNDVADLCGNLNNFQKFRLD